MSSLYKEGYNENTMNEWKEKSKIELKIKIRSNLDIRGSKLAEIINTLTKRILPNATLPYNRNALISIALNHIYMKVESWQGVNISAMNKIPTTFTQYHKRADNWWNRYKAEWVGDHYFYPCLQKELYQYISSITNNTIIIQLLYFMILSHIINAEIHYHRAKAQPLILDQSFIKSKDLDHLFQNIGIKNNLPWQIPINDIDSESNCNYRIIVRNYVKQWVFTILQQKQGAYNRMNTNTNIYTQTKCNYNIPHICAPTMPDDTYSQFSDNSKDSLLSYNYTHMHMHTVAPVRKRFHKYIPPQKHIQRHNTYHPLQMPSIPIRSHPYRIRRMYNNNHNNIPCIRRMASPVLTAQCEIKVYYDKSTPPIHMQNAPSITPNYSYTGVHSPSFSYIYDNESLNYNSEYVPL